MTNNTYSEPTTCPACGGHGKSHNNFRGCDRCGTTGVIFTAPLAPLAPLGTLADRLAAGRGLFGR